MPKIYHYAHKSVGDAQSLVVDPNKFHDKAVHGSYTANDRSDEGTPKSFWYNNPEKDKEHQYMEGKPLYVAEHHEKDVYDTREGHDKHGHAERSRGDVGHLIHTLKTQGFKGMRYDHGGSGPDTTILWHPLKAERTTEEHEFGKKIEDKTWKPDLDSGESMLDQMEKVKREKWPELYGEPHKLAANQAPKGGAIVNGRMAVGGQVTEKPKSRAKRLRNISGILAGIEKVTNREEKTQPVKLAGKAPKKPWVNYKKKASHGQTVEAVKEFTRKLREGETHGTGPNSIHHAYGIPHDRPITKGELKAFESAIPNLPEDKKISHQPGQQRLHDDAFVNSGSSAHAPKVAHWLDLISHAANEHLKAHGIDQIVKDNQFKRTPAYKEFLKENILKELQIAHDREPDANDHVADAKIHKAAESLPEHRRAAYIAEQRAAHEHAKVSLPNNQWYTKGMRALSAAFHHAHAGQTDDPMWGKLNANHPEGPGIDFKSLPAWMTAPGQVAATILVGGTSAQRQPDQNARNANRIIRHAIKEARENNSENWIHYLPKANYARHDEWLEKHADMLKDYPGAEDDTGTDAEKAASRIVNGKVADKHAHTVRVARWFKEKSKLHPEAFKGEGEGKDKTRGYKAADLLHGENSKGVIDKVHGYGRIVKGGPPKLNPLDRKKDGQSQKDFDAVKGEKGAVKKIAGFPMLDAEGKIQAPAFTTANDALKKFLDTKKHVMDHVQDPDNKYMKDKSDPSFTDPTHPDYKGPHGHDHESMRQYARWWTEHHTPDEIHKATKETDPEKTLAKLGYHEGEHKVPGSNAAGPKMGSFIPNMLSSVHAPEEHEAHEKAKAEAKAKGEPEPHREPPTLHGKQSTNDVWNNRIHETIDGVEHVGDGPKDANRKPNHQALSELAHDHRTPSSAGKTASAIQARLWGKSGMQSTTPVKVSPEKTFAEHGPNAIMRDMGLPHRFGPDGQYTHNRHSVSDSLHKELAEHIASLTPKLKGRGKNAAPKEDAPHPYNAPETEHAITTKNTPAHGEKVKLAARQTGVIKHKHLVYVSANDRDTHTTFKDVPAIKGGLAHKTLTEAAKAMPGVTHVEQAVEITPDGQEPTIVVNVHGGADTKDIHHIGASLGLRHGDEGKNQKAFVAFEHGKADDPDRIHHLVVKGKKLPEIHRQLQAHGIEYQTMVPLSGRGESARARVDILDRGHTLGDKVKAYQAHPESSVVHSSSHPGLVHYVGPPEDGKGTREEGAEAMKPHVRPDANHEKVNLGARSENANPAHRTGDAWVTPEADVVHVDHTVEHHGTAAKRLGYGHGKSAGEATTEMINKGAIRLRVGVGQIKDELLAESNQMPEIGGRKHKAIVAHALKHSHINRVVWYPRSGTGPEREIWNRQTHSESGE